MISALFMYMYKMKLVSIYQRCQLSNHKVHNYSYHISFFLLVRRRWVLEPIFGSRERIITSGWELGLALMLWLLIHLEVQFNNNYKKQEIERKEKETMYKKKKCFEKKMVVSGGLRKRERKREQWARIFWFNLGEK